MRKEEDVGGSKQAEIGTDIGRAAGLLRSGKLVGLPTETVYGLAAHGLEPTAVTQIFVTKNRPFFDPLILHVDTIEKARALSSHWTDIAEQLAQAFWPGPLTLVVPKSSVVPELVSSGHPTVAIRIPNHPVALDLLSQLDFPLAAPSANPFGYVSPTTAQHVEDQLGAQIPYILDGGPCQQGIESTIISCLPNELPTVLRLGSTSVDAIKQVVGAVNESLSQHSNPNAPGQLDQHYSPFCKLIPIDTVVSKKSPAISSPEKKVALLLFGSTRETLFEEHISGKNTITQYTQFNLSPMSKLEEAASNLFSMLRELDAQGFEEAWFQWVPEVGIGRAINDRLKRAAAKR